MADYFIAMKRYSETRSALTLSKCLKQRLWEDTQYQLKQLVGVGLVTAKVSTSISFLGMFMLDYHELCHKCYASNGWLK